MKIEQLDEWHGLTADDVRNWLRTQGWTRKPDGDLRRSGECWQLAEGAKGMCWLHEHKPSKTVEHLARITQRQLQALLRELNPRMRPGLPSQAAREAHTGLWIGHMGGKFPSPSIGYFQRLIGGMEWRAGSWVWDMAALEKADQAEYRCAFWPCDANGNKVPYPTNEQGEML